MKIIANGQELEVDDKEFMVLVHQQGIRVQMPEAVEINSRTTIKCMEEMSEKAWQHISTGQLFQTLFRTAFSDQPEITIPATIQELNDGDMGVAHVAGMIVLGCEAIFAGKTKLFYRNPENFLHPKTERNIVNMFRQMQSILGGSGTVTATTENPKENTGERREQDPPDQNPGERTG